MIDDKMIYQALVEYEENHYETEDDKRQKQLNRLISEYYNRLISEYYKKVL